MLFSRIRRPSPALVISVIALVFALVGTGYAAFKLPKNSVGTKQIKKNAVNGSKVKNHSLTGKDINLKKLGTVPSATNAAHAVSADTVAAEATHFIGAPGEPPFLSGSSNAPGESGVTFPRAGFFKDQAGVVHLQGIVKVGSGLPVIFTLPPGFRPAQGTIAIQNVFCFGGCETDEGGNEETYTRLLIAGSNTTISAGPEHIALDGDVLAGAETTVSLEGITFRAES
ncbi:MAG: hypothetical protein ACTHK6_01060 [Solirubrobacterales bacterium]